MTLTLRNIQYHPTSKDTGALAMLIEHPIGSFFVPTTEAALAKRCAPGSVWGNAEALAEAQAGVDAKFPGQGFTVVIPDSPAVTK